MAGVCRYGGTAYHSGIGHWEDRLSARRGRLRSFYRRSLGNDIPHRNSAYDCSCPSYADLRNSPRIRHLCHFMEIKREIETHRLIIQSLLNSGWIRKIFYRIHPYEYTLFLQSEWCSDYLYSYDPSWHDYDREAETSFRREGIR